MRTEQVIRKRLDAMRASKYRWQAKDEIGTLLWVLGEAVSPRQGVQKERAACWRATHLSPLDSTSRTAMFATCQKPGINRLTVVNNRCGRWY